MAFRSTTGSFNSEPRGLALDPKRLNLLPCARVVQVSARAAGHKRYQLVQMKLLGLKDTATIRYPLSLSLFSRPSRPAFPIPSPQHLHCWFDLGACWASVWA